MNILYSMIIQLAGFWLLENDSKTGILLIIIGVLVAIKMPKKPDEKETPKKKGVR